MVLRIQDMQKNIILNNFIMLLALGAFLWGGGAIGIAIFSLNDSSGIIGFTVFGLISISIGVYLFKKHGDISKYIVKKTENLAKWINS